MVKVKSLPPKEREQYHPKNVEEKEKMQEVDRYQRQRSILDRMHDENKSDVPNARSDRYLQSLKMLDSMHNRR